MVEEQLPAAEEGGEEEEEDFCAAWPGWAWSGALQEGEEEEVLCAAWPSWFPARSGALQREWEREKEEQHPAAEVAPGRKTVQSSTVASPSTFTGPPSLWPRSRSGKKGLKRAPKRRILKASGEVLATVEMV